MPDGPIMPDPTPMLPEQLASKMNISRSATPKRSTRDHPLDPLTPAEIVQCTSAIRAHCSALEKPIDRPYFNSVTLREPNKQAVLAWSGVVELEQQPSEPIVRQADIHMLDGRTGMGYEVIVDLPSNLQPSNDTARVSGWIALGKDEHISIQLEEQLWIEEVCRKDPKVIAACAEVGVKTEDLYVDGWCIANDERFPGRRLQQCFLFVRLPGRPDDNLYAHPLDFIPVIDSTTGELLTIDFPHQNGPNPPSSAQDHAARPPRERFAPPMDPHNYMPEELARDEPNFKPREGLKPIDITQPEGVSFQMNGRVIEWQNWSIHIGFNYREGLVLSNITYKDGDVVRPLFYRLSIAEMVVPYAKTTFPHHRKSAFDLGEYGIGAVANSLTLGCDCKGVIQYLDFDGVNRDGSVASIPQAVCIHEEDASILHRHLDFRTNKFLSVRNRKLIIQSCSTIANYEYLSNWSFDLAGSVELEIKATGIVNAYPLGPNEARDPAHEVEVAHRIAAQHHQHLFSLRVDPMIDGLRNQVVQVDTESDPTPTGSAENYYGNGFRTVKTVYETSKQSAQDYDARKSRSWAIENPHKQHSATGTNVSYKLVTPHMPPLLAQPGSMVWNRAPWARKNMFVTRYKPDEIYPSGMHINQHPGGPNFGLAEWVERDEKIADEDVVVWANFGVTHISRAEDWPIMPVEMIRVHLKPSNFFQRNPGLDVPSSVDAKSKYAETMAASSNGGGGAACCRT